MLTYRASDAHEKLCRALVSTLNRCTPEGEMMQRNGDSSVNAEPRKRRVNAAFWCVSGLSIADCIFAGRNAGRHAAR